MKLISNNTYDELVPVVRCRFCKWRPINMGQDVEPEKLIFPHDICPCASDDPWYNMEPSPNGYCWMGELDEKEYKP